jgi:hypothetical protein
MSKKLSIAPKEERSKRSYTLPNQVKKRDRNICQCCGFVYDHVEAHHIHWIEQGGAMTVKPGIAVQAVPQKRAQWMPTSFFNTSGRVALFGRGCC